MPIEKTIDNFADVAKSIRLLAETRVMAGVPSTKADRSDGPLNNAQLMYIHENGTFIEDDRGTVIIIPARPVVNPAIASIQSELRSRYEQIGNYAMDGKYAAVEKAFMGVGLLAQNAMQARIVEGPFVPLKASTLAARRRAGFAGTKPLIRSGKLKNSLTYVVRKVTWQGM